MKNRPDWEDYELPDEYDFSGKEAVRGRFNSPKEQSVARERMNQPLNESIARGLEDATEKRGRFVR